MNYTDHPEYETIRELLKEKGFSVRDILRLKGDYSERKIYRIFTSGPDLIAVYGGNRSENTAFAGFRETFEQAGIKVPALIAAALEAGIYILEDLGDTTLYSYTDSLKGAGRLQDVFEIYRKAVGTLPQIQISVHSLINYDLCYQHSIFGEENINSDLKKFEDFYLSKYLKKYNAAQFSKFVQELKHLILTQNNDSFLYRDFQPRNIMIKDSELYFIDFQSGRRGPLQYDLSSFLFSSSTELYPGWERELTEHYLSELDKYVPVDRGSFISSLPAFGCVRIMQAMGNYAQYFFERNDGSLLRKGKRSLEKIRDLSSRLNIVTGF